MATFNRTFDLGIFGEVTLPVSYTYSQSYPGTREEPGSDPEIEIDPINYQLKEGITLDLTSLMTETAYEQLLADCWEDHEWRKVDAAGERAQSRADARAVVPD